MVYRVWHLCVGAIYRTGRCIHQVFYTMVPATLQDIHKPDQVGIDIAMGVLYRVTYTGLGGQVNDSLGTFLLEQRLAVSSVSDVHLDEFKMLVAGQPVQAASLESDIIIVIKVIDPDDLVTPFYQLFCDSRSDKARRTCY